MKLPSWNCQGLGNPLTVQALRALVAQEKPNILFLMKTKNKELILRRLQKHLTFPNSLLEHPTGLAGGLAIFWQDHIYLTLEQQSSDFFDFLCDDRDGGSSMRLTCLRAPALVSLQRLFLATEVYALTAIGSDHCPLLLQTTVLQPYLRS